MEKSKEEMTISELIAREKRIREDEARQGFDYSQQKKLTDINYGDDGNVNDKINNIRYDANLYQNNKKSQIKDRPNMMSCGTREKRSQKDVFQEMHKTNNSESLSHSMSNMHFHSFHSLNNNDSSSQSNVNTTFNNKYNEELNKKNSKIPKQTKVNGSVSQYYQQFPNQVSISNTTMQMKPIASRNDIDITFNSQSQIPKHHLQQQPQQQLQQPQQQLQHPQQQLQQPQQQLQQNQYKNQTQRNPSLRGEFYLKSEKMDLKLDNKQLDLERINQMSQLDREMGIKPVVSYNNKVPLNSNTRNVNIQKSVMNNAFDFPKPEYNTRKTYYDDNEYDFSDPLNGPIRKNNNYQLNQQSQQQQAHHQKQQFNHYHQKHFQNNENYKNNQNYQNNGFAFNREPIAKNVINQALQGNFLENPQRMSFQHKNNHQQEMNQRLESRHPNARNMSYPRNNQQNKNNQNNRNQNNQNNRNQNNQNNRNHTGINPNYQPSIFMSLPVNTRDDI